jgi:hypothetical protein
MAGLVGHSIQASPKSAINNNANVHDVIRKITQCSNQQEKKRIEAELSKHIHYFRTLCYKHDKEELITLFTLSHVLKKQILTVDVLRYSMAHLWTSHGIARVKNMKFISLIWNDLCLKLTEKEKKEFKEKMRVEPSILVREMGRKLVSDTPRVQIKPVGSVRDDLTLFLRS